MTATTKTSRPSAAVRGNFSRHNMTDAQVVLARKKLERAMDAVVDGNMSELARRCGVRPQAVQSWVVRGVIPANRVMQVVAALEDQVDPESLRPDIFKRRAA